MMMGAELIGSRSTIKTRGTNATGFTFGDRGAAMYARIYDKSLHADADAPIRTKWRERGWDGEKVWRIEFEIRSEHLRKLVVSGERTASDPERVLASLGAIWFDAATNWLVLRSSEDRSRIERRRVEPWWLAVAQSQEIDEEPGEIKLVQRSTPPVTNVDALLRQATGLLAAISASQTDADIDRIFALFRTHVDDVHGPFGFAYKVAQAQLKREPNADRGDEAVRRRATALMPAELPDSS